jgi:raffinose/stachyose/melibiose transport system substrate-binding protein
MTHEPFGRTPPLLAAPLSRRAFGRLVGVAAGALAVAGCSRPGGSAGEAGSLTVLHDFEYVGKPGKMQEYWHSMLGRFSTATGTKTTDVPVAFRDLLPRIQSFNRARSGADLMTYYSNYNTFQFFTAGALAPIGDVVGGEDEMKHWLARCREFNGQQYFSPLFYELSVLVANKKMCAEAGVDVGHRFASWEAFTDALDKVKARGNTPYLIGNSDNIQAGLLADMFSMEVLEDPIQSSEWLSGRAGQDSPVATHWIQRMADLASRGRINQDALRITFQQAQERFTRGGAAFTNLFGAAAAALDPETFDIIPFWKGDGPLSASCAAAGDGLFMTKYASDPAKAGEFLKFIHQPEQLKFFYDTTGELPTDDRFTLKGANPLERRIEGFLRERSPAPYWPSEYVPPDLVTSGFAVYATKLLRGQAPDSVIQEFAAYLDRWRKTNPQLAKSLSAFVDAVRKS